MGEKGWTVDIYMKNAAVREKSSSPQFSGPVLWAVLHCGPFSLKPGEEEKWSPQSTTGWSPKTKRKKES